MNLINKNLKPGKWKVEAKRMAAGIRRNVLEQTINNNCGYLSQACSSAEIIATLFVKIVKFDSDRFFFSSRHYGQVIYNAVLEAGIINKDSFDPFGKSSSGIETASYGNIREIADFTGKLYKDLGQACGVAMIRKLKGENGRVILFMHSGEFGNGETWDSVQTMAFHNLENMLIFIDMNGYQIKDNNTSAVDIESLEIKLASFGAKVYRIYGHNLNILAETAEYSPEGRPVFVIADTDPCHGLDMLRSRYPDFHYFCFNNEDEKNLYRNLLKHFK